MLLNFLASSDEFEILFNTPQDLNIAGYQPSLARDQSNSLYIGYTGYDSSYAGAYLAAIDENNIVLTEPILLNSSKETGRQHITKIEALLMAPYLRAGTERSSQVIDWLVKKLCSSK